MRVCVQGAALERLVASPAWAPVLSLESVDGSLYASMISDFHVLLVALPPPQVRPESPGPPRIFALRTLLVRASLSYLCMIAHEWFRPWRTSAEGAARRCSKQPRSAAGRPAAVVT